MNTDRQIPAITVEFDLDTGEHVLMATSYAKTMPAGDRLLKSEPWPDITYRHATAEAAENAAAALRAYLANPPKAKRKQYDEELHERQRAMAEAVWTL